MARLEVVPFPSLKIEIRSDLGTDPDSNRYPMACTEVVRLFISPTAARLESRALPEQFDSTGS